MKQRLLLIALVLLGQIGFAQDVDFSIEDFEGSFLGLCYIYNGEAIDEDKLEEMPLIAYELANNEITILTETEDGEAEILAYDDLVYLGTAETQTGSKGLHYTIATEQENPETFSLIFWMDSDTDEKEFEIQYGESIMTFVIEVLEVDDEEETTTPTELGYTYSDFKGTHVAVLYQIDGEELTFEEMEQMPMVAFDIQDDYKVDIYKDENDEITLESSETLEYVGVQENQIGVDGLRYDLGDGSYMILAKKSMNAFGVDVEYIVDLFAEDITLTFVVIPTE